MRADLDKALLTFHNKAQQVLRRNAETQVGSGKFHVLRNPRALCAEAVEELEEAQEFADLVKVTDSTFGRRRRDLKNFFRQSGYYLDIFKDQPYHSDQLLNRFRQAFEQKDIVNTYLAPIELVLFAEEKIDLGCACIQRFSREELDEILNQRAKETFYPWASVNTDELASYWFLKVTEAIPTPAPRRSGGIRFSAEVPFSYSELPSALEKVLRPLILYDWQGVHPRLRQESPGARKKEFNPLDYPVLFRVPLFFKTSDWLLESPREAPDLSSLLWEPVWDPATRKEIGKGPQHAYYVSKDEAERLRKFMRMVGKRLEELERSQPACHFLDVGLGFLMKAFQTEGFEQLLWHITTIEALIGEKVETGLTSLLKKRVSAIMGKTEAERKEARKKFDELYKFRSSLIHGNADLSNKKLYYGHLTEARNLARKVALWMVNYLHSVHAGFSRLEQRLPDRDEILSLLDMEQPTRMSELLNLIPQSFPNVPEWEDAL